MQARQIGPVAVKSAAGFQPEGTTVNNDIPPYCVAFLGMMIGLLLSGPVQRWTGTLRRTLRERRRLGPRKGRGALLLIFSTMHPAPWLILIGVPFALYRIWVDPLRLTWTWLLTGMLLGPALALAFQAATARRAHRRAVDAAAK
jgi:hypothetical protein